ncbi:phage tail tape measure protein [Mediterraneibacter sp. NSJ-55]|uniref:Phage tail tape measure protein n=1 Tax=Mediterraneibacter hominis TaxID=2763054 RepID=A0A923LH51_9FIRM|nr:phage tail tape measure protein [Mediterraneibacter hominis]MBC5688223.1 phage tail tape measure protein [Mediterraneibacter hominis]
MGTNFNVDVNIRPHGAEKIDRLEQQINSLKNKNINLKFNISGINSKDLNFNKQFKNLGESAGKSYSTALQKQINAVARTQRNAFSEPLKTLTKAQQNYDDWWNKQLSKKSNANYGKSQQFIMFDQYLNQMKTVEEKAQEIKKRVSQSFLDVDTSSIQKNLRKFSGSDSESYKSAQASLEKLLSLQKELKTGVSNGGLSKTLNANEYIAKYNEYASILEKCKNQVKVLNNELVGLSKPISSMDAVTASNKTLTWLNNNTKAAKEYGEVLRSLAEKQKQATTSDQLSQYNKEFRQIVSEAQVRGLTGNSRLSELKRAASQIAEFVGIYGMLQNVILEVPRQMAQNVLDVDAAMTNLQMATGVTNTQAQELMSTYSKLGEQLKATSTDVATSATEWLKQGKSIEESQKLAEDSIVLSKIGDLSSEDATKTITAAMKSYNLDESEVMNFVDQISAIDMASATDVGGLASAFNEVAANARQAGVDTKQLLSYAAAIGETTQEGMSSVGTSLNAIFSRMGNIKLSRLKDYETGEDLSNVETVLRGVGISLRDSQDEFRDFDDVLEETANRWTSLSGVQQRAVSQAFAGTHHMNDFMVLMEQWENVEKYIETADNASGQSIQKYEAYTDSLAGKFCLIA